MSTAVKYNGAFTNRTGMRKLATVTPIPGAIRDWVFSTLPDGAVTGPVPDITDGHALDVHGATVITDSGRKYLRFDGIDDYADNLDLAPAAQPCTFVLVARLQGTIAAGSYLVGSVTTPVLTIGTISSPPIVPMGFGGSVVRATTAADTNRHTYILAAANGGTSTFRVDGTEVTGALGSNVRGTPRLGASYPLTGFTRIDVERFAILPYAAGSAERAALAAQLA